MWFANEAGALGDSGDAQCESIRVANRAVVQCLADGAVLGEPQDRRAVASDEASCSVEPFEAESRDATDYMEGRTFERARLVRCDRLKLKGSGEIVREDEDRQRGRLHVEGLDLLAQVLRRPADHESCDEDRDDHEDEHSVEPRANAAEDDFAELDVEHGDHSPQRGERVVHGIDRAAGSVGGDRGEQGGIEDAEADFLAFHVARHLGNAQVVQTRITGSFGPPANEPCPHEEHGHRCPDGPAVFLALDHPAQVIGQSAGNDED